MTQTSALMAEGGTCGLRAGVVMVRFPAGWGQALHRRRTPRRLQLSYVPGTRGWGCSRLPGSRLRRTRARSRVSLTRARRSRHSFRHRGSLTLSVGPQGLARCGIQRRSPCRPPRWRGRVHRLALSGRPGSPEPACRDGLHGERGRWCWRFPAWRRAAADRPVDRSASGGPGGGEHDSARWMHCHQGDILWYMAIFKTGQSVSVRLITTRYSRLPVNGTGR